MSFHVGQLVICVDDIAPDPARCDQVEWRHANLTRGRVYTIRGFSVSQFGPHETVLLCEIRRPKIRRQEVGFSPKRFRPLPSDRLSIFRQHLAPSPTDKVDA